MASIQTKLKKAFLLTVASGLSVLIFIVDVIRRSVEINLQWVNILRDVFVLINFLCFYLLIEALWKREQSPAKKLGFALVLSLVIGVASSLVFVISPSGYDVKNAQLIPLGFDSVIWANIYGLVIGITMLVVFLTIRDIIFSKRRKNTKRNFMALLILIIATSLSTLITKPLSTNTLASILQVLTIIVIVVNSFRLSWIVYLSKREKIYSVIYGFILFLVFIVFSVFSFRNDSTIGRAILFYSPPLQSFIWMASLFATIYFGMTFISTLFHLPTAEAFDRKISEVSSLHNLGRLVTQVFDFKELVETVTAMTLDVCGAQSAWLEVLPTESEQYVARKSIHEHDTCTETKIAAMKNISSDDVALLMSAGMHEVRTVVLKEGKPIIIDSVKEDKRTKSFGEIQTRFNSLVIVPLISHDTIIGILYVTKVVEYGFDKEDLDLISSFADQAAIAIENSGLIEKSIERERLMREMMLAQEMQKKLLPQTLPRFDEIEMEALSTPAFEVGGDYYDFVMLDSSTLGILVGDVSGKGVSAAFYMAEMKGIFQSLSRIYPEPRDFLINAHKTLDGSIDKRSFISLIYGIVDLKTGIMKVARAGHCPMLYVSNHHAEYIKPIGLGLGMGSGEIFRQTMTQEHVHLQEGDIVVFYTDGVTEAHRDDDVEFGYERLLTVVKENGDKSAEGIRDAIIMAVDQHMNHEPPEDDLTIVVMKWKKNNNGNGMEKQV
jgi:phosphoserine phosphatase RsbU/P